MLQRGIWIFVACCIVAAIWNTFPHSPKGFVDELEHKSEQLKGVASSVVEWMDLGRLEEDSAKTRDTTTTSGTESNEKAGQKRVQPKQDDQGTR